jgi:hypothetical protein
VLRFHRVTLRLPIASGGGEKAMASSSRHERHLNDAFLLLGTGEGGLLTSHDVAEAVRAMGIPTGLHHSEVMSAVDRGRVGVDFKSFRHMFDGGGVYRTQKGRHFVLLSLREAETLRANLHLERNNNNDLGLVPGPGHPTASSPPPALALHAMGQMGGGYTLDASDHFPQSQPFQTATAEACYRFVDAQTGLAPPAVRALLWALQV